MFAAPALGEAIEIVHTSLDPERGNYDHEVIRAIKSYVGSIFRESIRFITHTLDDGGVIIDRLRVIKTLSDMLPPDCRYGTDIRNIVCVSLCPGAMKFRSHVRRFM